MIDLHVHSTASDGTDSPRDLVRMAREIGLGGLALTDHDTVEGLPEATRAANHEGLPFVPGVELSAKIDRGALHIIGLHVDPTNTALKETLAWAVDCRNRRNRKMADQLTRLGKPTDIDEVSALARGPVVGRPHFAEYMVQKGHAKSTAAAFNKFLGQGKSAYVSKKKLDADRAIAVIRAAGGVPILAHPNQTGRKRGDLRRLISNLVDQGLAGIEVYYSGYDISRTRAYIEIAKKFDLVLAGGSDYHGANKPGIALGRGPGRLCVPESLLGPLAARAARIRGEIRRERVGIEPT